MALKHRDAPGGGFPPGGYVFYQPQTNWRSSNGLTFWQTVDEILAHRSKNPRFANQWALDRAGVADELDAFTCIRLNHDRRFCDVSVKKNSLPRSWRGRLSSTAPEIRGAAAGAAADRAENLAAGVGVVLDWLGDSLEPVAVDLAERRAAVCAVCPQNGRPDFIQRLEGWAASGVKQLIKLTNDLDLKTGQDDRLHHCQACDCALRLKVWARLDHILAHTSQRVMGELDPRCWIKTQDK